MRNAELFCKVLEFVVLIFVIAILAGIAWVILSPDPTLGYLYWQDGGVN